MDDDQAKHQRFAEKRNAGYEKKQAKATTEKGLVIVNTGTGKGKSTAAFGMALRAIGHGMGVGVVQFIKGAMATAERDLLDAYEQVEFHTLGDGFTWKTQDRDKDMASAAHAWSVAERLLGDDAIGLVVLDELNWALKYEYVDLDAVLAALAARPAMQHVVITGRNAPDRLVEAADMVNEIRAVKHPYKEQGVKAQAGVEF
ncbi:MAG: cob(I)yrinic acid a,c-diamide adenosyltransferase [Pseudomonadota bacterium]